jgi:hypothetical protein
MVITPCVAYIWLYKHKGDIRRQARDSNLNQAFAGGFCLSCHTSKKPSRSCLFMKSSARVLSIQQMNMKKNEKGFSFADDTLKADKNIDTRAIEFFVAKNP